MNSIRELPEKILSTVFEQASNAVNGLKINRVVEAFSEQFNAAVEKGQEVINAVVIKHLDVVASTISNYITPDNSLTAFSGLAGTALLAKGGYDLIHAKKDKAKTEAEIEIAVGVLGVGYAMTKIALSILPFFKRQIEDSIKESKVHYSWLFIASGALAAVPSLLLLLGRCKPSLPPGFMIPRMPGVLAG